MATVIVAEVPSSRNPSEKYKVMCDDATQAWSCTCMDYLTRRRFKGEHCKHIKEIKSAQDFLKNSSEAQ